MTCDICSTPCDRPALQHLPQQCQGFPVPDSAACTAFTTRRSHSSWSSAGCARRQTTSSAACPPIWSKRPPMPPRLRSPTPTCAHAVIISCSKSTCPWPGLVPNRHCPTFADSIEELVCPVLQGGLMAGRRASCECRAVAVLAMHTQAGHSLAVCGTSHCGRITAHLQSVGILS